MSAENITLATASATVPVLFLTVRAYTAYRPFFCVAGTDVKKCKSFNLKKTLYDSSTVAQIRALRAEHCIVGIPHNTVI